MLQQAHVNFSEHLSFCLYSITEGKMQGMQQFSDSLIWLQDWRGRSLPNHLLFFAWIKNGAYLQKQACENSIISCVIQVLRSLLFSIVFLLFNSLKREIDKCIVYFKNEYKLWIPRATTARNVKCVISTQKIQGFLFCNF